MCRVSPPSTSLARPPARPVAGFRLPVVGPLSFQPSPPPSAWRFFLPASGKHANKVPASPVRRHRSRNVGPGRGFSFFAATSSPPLWQPLRGKASCRRNCVRTPPRPRHRPVPSDPSASSAPVSVLKPVADHVSLSPTAGYCQGRRRFGLPASAPDQARRRSLPRPAPASPPPAVTHAPGNEVSADPAAASRCSLRSRLSLSALVSPRRLRRERGSRSVLPVCRRQPPRLRSLPVADHASLLTIAGQGMKKAAAVSLLRFTHGSCRPPIIIATINAAPSTITSHYVEVVRCASTARASPARPEGLHNECYPTCRLLWPSPPGRIHPAGIAAAAAVGSVWQLSFDVAARGLQPAFLFAGGLPAPCSRRLAE